jgi:HEAT repeat protein/WD40 repeat protein
MREHIDIDPARLERESALRANRDPGLLATVNSHIADLSDQVPETRSSAAESLGRMGAQQALSALLDRLEDAEPKVRGASARAIGRLIFKKDASSARTDAVHCLIGAVHDPSDVVRAAAAQALGRAGDADALVPLLGLVQDESREVRKTCGRALGAVSSRSADGRTAGRALDDLESQLRQSDLSVRVNALSALSAMAPYLHRRDDYGRAVSALGQALDRGDAETRVTAAEALVDVDLGRLARKQQDVLIGQLVRSLHRANHQVRQLAARTLGEIGAQPVTDAQRRHVVHALIRTFGERELSITQMVAELFAEREFGGSMWQAEKKFWDERLQQTRDEISKLHVRQLAKRLLSAAVVVAYQIGTARLFLRSLRIRHVSEESKAAVRAIGEPSVTPLLRSARSLSTRRRVAALDVLARADDPRVVRALLRSLASVRPRVRAAAAEALGRTQARGAVPALNRALRDRNAVVRRAAAGALQSIRAVDDIEPLRAALRDEASAVRTAAAQALAAIGNPGAAEALAAALRDRDPEVRSAAAVALRDIGQPGTIDVLTRSLTDTAVRKTVSGILKELGWKPDDGDYAVHYRIGQEEFAECARYGAAAVDPLLEELNRLDNNDNTALKEKVIAALGDIADSRAVPALASLLAECTWNVGEPDPSPSPALFSRPSYIQIYAAQSLRRAIANALAKIGDEQATIALCDVVRKAARNHPESDWTAGEDDVADVLAALGKIGDWRAGLPILTLIGERFDKWRYQGVQALQQIGWEPDTATNAAPYWVARHDWVRCRSYGPDAKPDVQRYLTVVIADEAEPAQVRGDAVRTLGSMRDTSSIPVLVDALVYPQLRNDVEAALAKFGKPCVDALIEATKQRAPDVRSAAISSLTAIAAGSGTHGPARRIVTAFGDRLEHDEEPAVRRSAVAGLAALATKQSGSAALQRTVDLLVHALGDTETVSDAAVDALVGIGAPAVPLLVESARPGHGRGAQAAVRCLQRIGGGQAQDAVREYYEALTSAPDPVSRGLNTKAFRVFVSSTFEDFEEERKILQGVFRDIERLCRNLGASFEAIDLRCGVSEEAARNQQTMDICLEELARCRQVSPELNFVALLGDRYGSTLLPSEIPASIFEKILQTVPETQKHLLLYDPDRDCTDNGWYRRDDNARPRVYCLRPRLQAAERICAEDFAEIVAMCANAQAIGDLTTWYKPDAAVSPAWYLLAPASQDADGAGRDRAVDAAATLGWRLAESRIRDVLYSATADPGYVQSATHREIQAGILDDRVDVADGSALCFFREFRDLSDEKAHVFREASKTGRRRLAELKRALEEKVPREYRHTYSVRWKKAELDEYHKRFRQDVYESLSRAVAAHVSRFRAADAVTYERERHEEFARDTAESFQGREDLLRSIRDYLDGNLNRPTALIGPSGCGKTSLLAYVVAGSGSQPEEPGSQPRPGVFARFVGVTPASTDIRTLLRSLCRELARHQGADPDAVPRDYPGLVGMFASLLEGLPVSADRPITVIVDGLDQLAGASDPEHYGWIPERLPDHVKLIVSSLPGGRDEYRSLIENAVGAKNVIQVGPMTEDDCVRLLEGRLRRAHRSLTPDQWAVVSRRIAGCHTPLYVVLLSEEVRRWKSYDGPGPAGEPRLGEDVPGILRSLFSSLSGDDKYGPVLLGRCLGYLGAARYGLTDSELIHLLSTPDVLTDLRRLSPRSRWLASLDPEAGELPTVIWAQLHSDLRPYLVHRSHGGQRLIALFHRAFQEAVARQFLAKRAGTDRHRELAEYFSDPGEQPTWLASGTPRIPNVRKCTELLYHSRPGTADRPSLRLHLAALTDFDFIAAKCAAGLVDELAEDYESALNSEAFASGELKRIDAFARFVGARRPVLRTDPEAIWIDAVHFLDRVIDTSGFVPATEWIRWVNKPAGIDCRQVPAGRLLLTLPDDDYMLTSYGKDLCLWSLERLRFVRLFEGHRGQVTAAAAWPGAVDVVTADDANVVKVWDVRTGVCSSTTELGTGRPASKLVSAPGKRLAVAREGGAVELWNLESGKQAWAVDGLPDVEDLCLDPAGEVLVARNRDRITILDLRTGDCRSALMRTTGPVIGLLAGSSGSFLAATRGEGGDAIQLWDVRSRAVRGVLPDAGERVLFTDGTRLVSQTGAGGFKTWDVGTCCCMAEHSPASASPGTVAVSADGNRLAALSGDGTVSLWTLAATGMSPSGQFATHQWVHGTSPHLGISGDGGTLVFSQGRNLLVWDTAEAKSIGTLVAEAPWEDEPFTAVTVSAAGDLIVAGDTDGRLYFWNPVTGRKWTVEEHDGPVNCLQVVAGKNWLVSGSSDCTAAIWSLSPEVSKQVTITHSNEIRQVSVSPDGRYLLLRDAADEVHARDLSTGARICRFNQDAGEFAGVLFGQPSGPVGLSIGQTIALRLWSLTAGTLTREVFGEPTRISGYAVVPGERLGICSRDGAPAEVWDQATWTVPQRLDTGGRGIALLAIAPGGRLALAVLDGGRDLTAWDVTSGKRLWTAHSDAVIKRCTVVERGGRCLAVAEEEPSAISVWDAERGGPARKLERLLYWIASEDDEPGAGTPGAESVLVMDDGRRAVSAYRSSVARIWDLKTGQPTGKVDLGELITGMSASKRSSVVLGGSGGAFKVYDTSLNLERWSDRTKDRKPMRSVWRDPAGSVHWSNECEGLALDDQRWLVNAPQALIVTDPGGGQRDNNVAAKSTVPYFFYVDKDKKVTAVPGSNLVIWWNGKLITVWDIDAMKLTWRMDYQGAQLSAVAAADRQRFVTGDDTGAVGLWAIDGGAARSPRPAHAGRVTSAAWAPDASSYLTAGSDGAVIVWDPVSGAEMARFHGLRDIAMAVYTPDASKIVALDRAGDCYLLHLENWRSTTGASPRSRSGLRGRTDGRENANVHKLASPRTERRQATR